MNPTIAHNFKNPSHRGFPVHRHEAIRTKAAELAHLIDEELPPEAGRERATAITKVEEAMFWAHAGLARHT